MVPSIAHRKSEVNPAKPPAVKNVIQGDAMKIKKPFVAMSLCVLALYTAVFAANYEQYSDLLQKNVHDGRVDYKNILTSKSLTKSLDELNISREYFDTFDDQEKIAYVINLYNLYTIKLIVDNYPVKSIKDLDKPWDSKIVPFQGEQVSLNHLEHKVLRGKFDEPKIHFALVCASIGCPNISNEPFTGDRLDIQLTNAAISFLQDETKNKIQGKKLHLSKIFKWYGKDFKNRYGSYKNFIMKTMSLEGSRKVTFLDYDWNLNSTGN